MLISSRMSNFFDLFMENADSSSLEDEVGETDNNGNGDNFDAENALDSMVNLEKINFKETCSEQMMRYHFPDREAAFNFYN